MTGLRRQFRAWVRNSRSAQLALRRLRPHTRARMDWRRLVGSSELEWGKVLESARAGRRVLIATSTGSNWACSSFESVLAAALTLRGAQVELLLCDGVLPACQECDVRLNDAHTFATRGPVSDLCQTCFEPANAMLAPLGLRVHRLSGFLDSTDFDAAHRDAHQGGLDEFQKYRQGEMALGEHAYAAALRFFARGDMPRDVDAERVARRYLQAAILTARAMERLLEAGQFEVAVFHHGIYVPQGIVGEVARQRGVRVVNWNPAYRRQTFIFSHGDTYHRTMLSEPAAAWERLELSGAMESRLTNYLRSRWHGNADWIVFQDQPEVDPRAIAEKYRIDPTRPCIGLLTNVIWDAQLHYPANAFPNMLEWLFHTIEHFSRRQELQLLVRVHPAEVLGAVPARQKVLDEIRNRYPRLPSNIIVIPPEDRIGTYAAMSLCRGVIIYGTKAGIELACQGVPVIAVGEAWVRNKGISSDISSIEQYRRLLERLPQMPPVSTEAVARARKYAFHFFFRRMIPVSFARQQKNIVPYTFELQDMQALRPGRDPGIDAICDGILAGQDFVYPAEHLDG